MVRSERLEGYVVDILCLRKYARDDLVERAREHTRDCALHGECIESGYGLVTDEGEVLLLDDAATRLIVERIVPMAPQAGIRVRAEREEEGEEMRTRLVEVRPAAPSPLP